MSFFGHPAQLGRWHLHTPGRLAFWAARPVDASKAGLSENQWLFFAEDKAARTRIGLYVAQAPEPRLVGVGLRMVVNARSEVRAKDRLQRQHSLRRHSCSSELDSHHLRGRARSVASPRLSASGISPGSPPELLTKRPIGRGNATARPRSYCPGPCGASRKKRGSRTAASIRRFCSSKSSSASA